MRCDSSLRQTRTALTLPRDDRLVLILSDRPLIRRSHGDTDAQYANASFFKRKISRIKIKQKNI